MNYLNQVSYLLVQALLEMKQLNQFDAFLERSLYLVKIDQLLNLFSCKSYLRGSQFSSNSFDIFELFDEGIHDPFESFFLRKEIQKSIFKFSQVFLFIIERV